MQILTFAVVLALLATIFVLGSGIVSMMRGGAYDAQHSSELMSARVGLQGIAVLIALLALLLSVSF